MPQSSVMGIKFPMFLLLSVCAFITSTMAQQDLFGVMNDGNFYKGNLPQTELDNWFGSATLIGTGAWKDFQHLFFHPDGTLYGVLNGKFYKGSPPTHDNDNWLARATLVGSGGWDVFQFLFFGPLGILYGVVDDKFYRRLPPTHSQDNWLGSATRIGTGGWSVFKFLFFDPDGVLWAVQEGETAHGSGDLLKGMPPRFENDNWLDSYRSIWVGTYWDEYDKVFFTADAHLYSVKNDEFWRHEVYLHGKTRDTNWQSWLVTV